MTNWWKVTAITFITITILGFAFLIWASFEVISDERKEIECNTNICDMSIYDTYYYDEILDLCYCNIGADIIKTKYLGR